MTLAHRRAGRRGGAAVSPCVDGAFVRAIGMRSARAGLALLKSAVLRALPARFAAAWSQSSSTASSSACSAVPLLLPAAAQVGPVAAGRTRLPLHRPASERAAAPARTRSAPRQLAAVLSERAKVSKRLSTPEARGRIPNRRDGLATQGGGGYASTTRIERQDRPWPTGEAFGRLPARMPTVKFLVADADAGKQQEPESLHGDAPLGSGTPITPWLDSPWLAQS